MDSETKKAVFILAGIVIFLVITYQFIEYSRNRATDAIIFRFSSFTGWTPRFEMPENRDIIDARFTLLLFDIAAFIMAGVFIYKGFKIWLAARSKKKQF